MVTEQDWKPGVELICVEANSCECVVVGQIYPVNHSGHIICGCNFPIGPAPSWFHFFDVHNPLGPW